MEQFQSQAVIAIIFFPVTLSFYHRKTPGAMAWFSPYFRWFPYKKTQKIIIFPFPV